MLRTILARLAELAATVLPDRLQQPEPGPTIVVLTRHDTFGHQSGQGVQHLLAREILTGAHRFCGLQVEAALKHRRAHPQTSLGFGTQLEAAVHGRVERLMTRGRGSSTTSEQPESSVEPTQDLRHRKHGDPRRRQLDSQRIAVQHPADLCDRSNRVNARRSGRARARGRRDRRRHRGRRSERA